MKEQRVYAKVLFLWKSNERFLWLCTKYPEICGNKRVSYLFCCVYGGQFTHSQKIPQMTFAPPFATFCRSVHWLAPTFCHLIFTWHMTHETWNMTLWHVTHRGWWTLSQIPRSLNLTNWELWYHVTCDIGHIKHGIWHNTH